MKKTKMTFRQKLGYAHWSAKFAFDFPYIGYVFMIIALALWFGLALWFFEPTIISWEHFSGPHALAKKYFCRMGGVLLLLALSYLTVYIVYFIIALFDRDEVCRRHFLRYHYRKY